ncbi:carbohydrate esterase family 3 protein, partial [Cercospora zeae-maydis SCOH1-5]
LRMMFVGDSITHGFEADYTWRFRLWEWLKATDVPFTFVGPYTGVCGPMAAHPPRPPRLMELPPPGPEDNDDFPRIEWGYAKDVPSDFDAHHFATSGERADRVKELIHARVEEYRPEMLLILLGFNDLSWGGAQPEVLLENIKTIVDVARASNANTKFIIGNVVHEQFGSPDLDARTSAYNELLNSTYPSWSTAASPVHYADVAAAYTCGPHRNCTSTIDGLHPNDLGAYQIANAFSKPLIDHFSIGHQPVQIPSTWTDRAIDPPSNLKASGSPMGITVTWDRPFGVPQFNVRRRSGDEGWTVEYGVGMNRTDTILPRAGIQYEYQVRSCLGLRCSKWSSESVTAISDRRTSPPPENVRTTPTPLGFEVEWSPPEDANSWNITQYDVLFINRLLTDVQVHVGTRNHSAILEGLPSGPFSIVGHILDVGVSVWTDPEGGGLPTFGRQVRPGTTRTPRAPSRLRSKTVNGTAVRLTWEWNKDSAGF